MTPTVAIIVRTKNRPQFLTRALADIAEQTYQDYAVYVVNDGGDRAETERIVTASPVANKTTLLHTDGIGMEAASNLGVRESESTYVTVHDDDDLWDPKFLKHTVAALDSTGAKMCTVRIVERFERETDNGFQVLNERIFHEGLPIVGLQSQREKHQQEYHPHHPQNARHFPQPSQTPRYLKSTSWTTQIG